MCGIASIALLKSASTKIDLEAGTDALLKALMSRGRDASGIMAIQADGRVFTQKAAVDGYDFALGRASLPKGTRAVGVHTRLATQGPKGWMRNNHPVECGKALVCHNGVVADEWLTRKQSEPEVDTFALSYLANAEFERGEGETLSAHAARIVTAMAQVEGSKAVQVAFRGQPLLISARITGSPLYFGETNEGVVITASTVEAVKAAAKAMDLTFWDVEQEVTKKVKGEDVTTTEKFLSIWDNNPGQWYAWEAGTLVRGIIPEVTEHKHKREVKVKSYAGAYQGWQGSGTAWKSDSKPKHHFNVGSEVTVEAKNHHMHGRKGTISVIGNTTVDVQFADQEYLNERHEKVTKVGYTGIFSPDVLMFWSTFVWIRDRDERDAAVKAANAKSAAKSSSTTTSNLAKSAHLSKNAQRKQARDERRRLINEAIDDGRLDPHEQDKATWESDVSHVLKGEERCELCQAWTPMDELEEVEDVGLCGMCTGIVRSNPHILQGT